MTQIAAQVREPVEATPRLVMSYGAKLRRWNEVGRVCMVCKKRCEPAGPTVIWDHRVPLALGGSNHLANMEPNHAETCAAIKTARDRRNIAKAARLRRDADPETRRKSPYPIRGRGFRKADELK